MKVQELIENEWENVPIEDKKRLREINRKLNSLYHRREVLQHDLSMFTSNSGNDDGRERLTRLLKFETAIKKLEAQRAELNKQRIGAQLNMKYIIHDPFLAFQHAKAVRQGRFPEGEDAIASNAETAARYALEVTRQRFMKGEAAMYAADTSGDPRLDDYLKQYDRFFSTRLRYKPKVPKI